MLNILYSDQHLLICAKPAGMPAQPDPSGQPDFLTAVQTLHPAAHLIHRLDTPTGGVMVFGLTQAATAGLSALVQDHSRFLKDYLAVTSQPPEVSEGTLLDYLYHDHQRNKAYIADSMRRGAKEASLNYRVLHTTRDGHTLLLIRLHTGRTHQIRVQFASRGWPLCGDGKYGSREKHPYIGLWATRLSFLHPVNGHYVSVHALPDIHETPWAYFDNFLNSNSILDV